jgi:sugar diacid utilization regulator
MAQITTSDLVGSADRFGLEVIAGPTSGPRVTRIAIVDIDRIDDLGPGTLAIISAESPPPPFRMDIAIRQASARQLGGLVFVIDPALPATAAALAERGNIPVLLAPGARPSELALALDRRIGGGATETMARAAFAVERVTAAGADGQSLAVLLEVAGTALGTSIRLVQDSSVAWTAPDAVLVGAVPLGRLEPDDPDDATALAIPVIASVLSRAMDHEVRERFAPTQSRADLIVELILAESSRVQAFTVQAARLDLPLQHEHVAAWLKPTLRSDTDRRPPHTTQPPLKLFALQLVDQRDELWHVAFIQDDMVVVCSEEPGSGDHQRRVREVGVEIMSRARELAGPGWDYTLGLGTPQVGPAGLRQSAAEARVAAEAAIAAGRPGGIEVTDVTGLRRVLLDFYASPTSRTLLQDILHPLDALGEVRATAAARTLLLYLGHRNSLARAGAELNLHPNAVAYRIKRIQEALHLDLHDPDTRFAVELACRVRLLSTAAA